MSGLVPIISTLYLKADPRPPKKKRNTLLGDVVLAGASLALLALIQSHSRQIEDLVKRLYDGRISPGMFRSQFERMLADNAQNAYATGAGRALTKSDRALVRKWADEQSLHIRSFLDDNLTDATIAGPLLRVGLWAAALSALATVGFMYAHPTVMGTWNYGDTVKHCETCASLDGKSMPLSEYMSKGLIPQEPASKTLSCGGWKCLCTIDDSITGKVLLPLHLLE